MKVAINGLFLQQPFTGTGQYTRHLLEHMEGLDLQVSQPVHQGNIAKLWWEQVEWPRLVQQARADMMHSPYFALPAIRPVPAIATIHDVIPLLLPAYRGSALVRSYTWLQALACRTAQALIVDSECSKRDLIRLTHIPEERVHVVYLGIDAGFSPDRSGESPLERPYVFYVGGWDVRKNVPRLIEAFQTLSQRIP